MFSVRIGDNSAFDFEQALDAHLQWHLPTVRKEIEKNVRDFVAEAIGEENLAEVTLTFFGNRLDNLELHVAGPRRLQAKIAKACRARKR
jgi:hypothetical protein